MRWMTYIAALVFALDQISKYVVVHLMNLRALGAIEVFPPFLNFRMAWNQGINFGLLSAQGDAGRWILIGVAVLISGWVVLWVRREEMGLVGQISAGLMVGGALGNVVDRLIYGAVADFLNMSCCGFNNPFAFNVADIGVFAGALGLVVFSGNKKTP